MKYAAKIWLIIIIIALVVIPWWIFRIMRDGQRSVGNEQSNNSMIITSPSFEEGGFIPRKYSCEGGDINPELHIHNVPDGAKSLALILHDPDAPVPGGFTHWIVWNIDPKTTVIKEESTPPGSVEGMNGAGKAGYIGPCPPSGVHHYHFQLYALDAKLDLPGTTTEADLLVAIAKQEIEKAELIGLYQK